MYKMIYDVIIIDYYYLLVSTRRSIQNLKIILVVCICVWYTLAYTYMYIYVFICILNKKKSLIGQRSILFVQGLDFLLNFLALPYLKK